MLDRIVRAVNGLSRRRLVFPLLLVVVGSLLWLITSRAYLHKPEHQVISAVLWFLFALMILVPRIQASLIAEPKDWLEADNKARQTIIQVIGGLVILGGAFSAWRQFASQQDQFAEQRRQFQEQLKTQQVQAEQQRRQFEIQMDNQGKEKDQEQAQFQLQFQNQQHQLEEQRKQFKLQFDATREEQTSQRFTRAVEQLANETLDIRLGGIYALERVSRDSPDRQWTVLEVLAAYIRERARWVGDAAGSTTPAQSPLPRPAPDIQAALTVLARNSWPNLDLPPRPRPGTPEQARMGGYFPFRANLAHTDLRGADLIEAVNFLKRADLTGAHLERADLRGAVLDEAILDRAFLNGARLDGARLRDTYMRNASLLGAVLENADFRHARLENASLACTYSDGADFSEADIGGGSFERASLSRRTNFTGARLSYVILCDPFGAGYTQHPDDRPPQRFGGGSGGLAGDFTRTRLSGVDMRGCSVSGISGWQEVADFRYANIHGVKNAPDGFAQRALLQGAVSIADFVAWRSKWTSGSPGPFMSGECPDTMPPEWYADTPR